MIWKILFVIYALIMIALGFMGMDSGLQAEKTLFSEAIVNTCIEIMLILALIYTFALGWKKRLISEKYNKWFLKFSFLAFVFVGIFLYKHTYAPMYSDMLLQAMENGMVPRHWDFQMLLAMTRIEVLIFVLLALFIIFVPFYLGYYHYTKRMTELGVAEHSGRKCFAVYVISSYIFIFLAIFFGMSGEIVNFNIFDCISTLSGIYIALGLLGYAFKQEILNQMFWRITLPLCVVIELLPASFFSADFKNAIGWTATQASPVYVLSSYIMTAVAIFMIYRYACTDVVFKPVKPENNSDESI